MIPNGYDDRKRAIYQIQLWLRTLAATGMPIRTLTPDGIYDEKTGDAVKVFQGISGLETTGSVDYVTWIALRDGYRMAIASSAPSKAIFPFEYALNNDVVTEGDAFSLVYIIQVMIGELRSVYRQLGEQQNDGVFDERTARNVKVLQEVWQLPQTGQVDKETWNMLADAYNKNLNKE